MGLYDTSIWVPGDVERESTDAARSSNVSMYEATLAESFHGWTDQYSSVWPLLHSRHGAREGG